MNTIVFHCFRFNFHVSFTVLLSQSYCTALKFKVLEECFFSFVELS